MNLFLVGKSSFPILLHRAENKGQTPDNVRSTSAMTDRYLFCMDLLPVKKGRMCVKGKKDDSICTGMRQTSSGETEVRC